LTDDNHGVLGLLEQIYLVLWLGEEETKSPFLSLSLSLSIVRTYLEGTGEK
jgi:hypothetical protein